jgi:cell division protein FtsL
MMNHTTVALVAVLVVVVVVVVETAESVRQVLSEKDNSMLDISNSNT